MGSWAEGMKKKKPSPRLVILQHLKFRRSEATGVVIVDRRNNSTNVKTQLFLDGSTW